MINIFNTYISPEAASIVNRTLDSTMLSEGKLVKEFENLLKKKTGLVNPLALNSGTSALHLALSVAGIGEGDEVICPAQTFVATALVVKQQNAIPVFVDIDYATGNIDPKSIQNKITHRTKAILIVHWGGYPCDIDEVIAIARKHNLIVIEDAAHAIGATYKNKFIGSISDFTCFSFQAIKHITTGDGGALSCLSEEYYLKALKARWFGINRTQSEMSELGERIYDIDAIGFKYHLNDYAAALGIANIDQFDQRLKMRRAFAAKYDAGLQNIKGITLFNYQKDRESSYWLYGFHVENRLGFIRKLKEKGIAASVVHQRIDHNSLFGGINSDLINQTKFDDTQIHIPMHDALDNEQIEYILHVIKSGW